MKTDKKITNLNLILDDTTETVIPTPGSKISTYRMKLCANLKRPGGCRNGKNCIYAHSKHQLRTCKIQVSKI